MRSTPFRWPEYVSKKAIAQHPSGYHDNASDEEFILQEVGAVRNTADINVIYEDASGKSRVSNAGSGMRRDGKLC